MSYSVDDTQPVAPFQGEPINLRPTIQPGEESIPPRGGSCLLTGLIGGMLIFIAVVIVALSAAAGWTSGQREASINATATQGAAIGEQLQHLSDDISSGNLVLLDVRLRWLATNAPDAPGVAGFVATATALYQSALPTETMATEAAPTQAAAVPQVTEDQALTEEPSGGYDLAGILNQAESAIASSQWQDAIDLLDVILGADPGFENATVRRLMSQALNSYARELYNANQPAQANVVVARARDFGALADGLEFENMAANYYLQAKAAVGTGSPAAIDALQHLLDLGPGRYYEEAQHLLYDFYVAQGDGYVAQGNNCTAVYSYQNAISLYSSGVANGKYSFAQNACANATPTIDPNLVIPSDGQVAPVGVVATQPGT